MYVRRNLSFGKIVALKDKPMKIPKLTFSMSRFPKAIVFHLKIIFLCSHFKCYIEPYQNGHRAFHHIGRVD